MIDDEIFKSEFDKIDAAFERRAKELPEGSTRFIAAEWNLFSQPELRRAAAVHNWDAETYRQAAKFVWGVTEDLFVAIHDASPFIATNAKQLHCFWEHRRLTEVDFIKPSDGVNVHHGQLHDVAARYVSRPEARTGRLDWLFLDTIVFQELKTFAAQALATDGFNGTNWAVAYSDGDLLKYWGYRLFFWVLKYLAAPAIVVVLFLLGKPYWGLGVAAMWIVYLLTRLAGLPARMRKRRRARALLQCLTDTYALLGGSVISPRLLKEALDKGNAVGVGLDGAVFAIVDRLVARDPTAFVPNPV